MPCSPLKATLIVLAVALCVPTAMGASGVCGDCDESWSLPITVNDALAAIRIHLDLATPSVNQLRVCDVDGSCSVTVLDALAIAQRAVSLPVTFACRPVGSGCAPEVTACRAVHALGAMSTGPVGVNPAYATLNGGGGAPPISGDIADTNQWFENFWDLDYTGLNQGEFNSTVSLTDAGGNNVGNPVLLYSAGHDYSAEGSATGAPCNPQDAFQIVLEATVVNQGSPGLLDLAAAITPFLGSNFHTSWTSSDPGVVSVSPDGYLRAESENGCSTISWSFTNDTPGAVTIACLASGNFAACVDSGGVDTATRASWLPLGDLDANLPGLPSGPPHPSAGADFGYTTVINTGTFGLGAGATYVHFDPTVILENTAVDTMSIGGSTQPGLGLPFSVNPLPAGEVHWCDVDAFATSSGIYDYGGVNFTAVGAGVSPISIVQLETADGNACNIWRNNPCMPHSTFAPCGPTPPVSSYDPVACGGTITVP